MENVANFSAHNVDFGTFFDGRTPYRVPRFQRPYSWEQDHVIDFWADLNNDSVKNFIGSFVFNYEYERGEGFIDIIDGQQRFLTTTIFCAAIRDYFREDLDSAENADLIQRHNIVFEDEDGEYQPRIVVGDSARGFFETYIQNNNGGAVNAPASCKEEQRIRSNYKYFRERLSEYGSKLSVSQQLKQIKGLLKKLKNSSVIHIRIASEEDAFEIFETVNARGVELSVGDLLKNLVFKKITERGDSSLDAVHSEWTEMLQNLDGTGFDLPKFIRYYWVSKSPFVGSKGLFKSIKRNTGNYRTLLDALKRNAELLGRLAVPSEDDFASDFPKYSARIARSLRGLSLMRVTQCYVFLLAMLRNVNFIKPKRFLEVISKIENFTFVYALITKGAGNRVERVYARHALELEKAVSEADVGLRSSKVGVVLNNLLKDLEDLLPTKEQFLKGFSELKYGNTSKARQTAAYILARIDAHIGGTGELVPDFEMVNIEHVLPQRPTAVWKVSKRDLNECVNLLGNLTLVSKKINSQIGNGPLDAKLDELSKSKMAITEKLVVDIREEPAPYRWGKQQILSRHQALGELAYEKVWKF